VVNFCGEKTFYTEKNMSEELHTAYLAEQNTQSVVHVSTQTLVQINPLYGGFCQVRRPQACQVGKPGVCRCVPGRIYRITQPTLFGVKGQGIAWERSRICWPCNLQQRVNYAELKSSINPSRSPLRASPTVIGVWSCTVKLDEENLTYAGLAQENGIGST